MTTHREEITIELTDDERGTLRLIPITITYLIERDTDYGSDADGRRGVTREELHILDTAIDHEYLTLISVDEAVTIINLAIQAITERPVSR